MKKNNLLVKDGVDWEFVRELEAQLLQEMTVHEGLLRYQALHMEFEWQLQQTAELFAKNHQQALLELQDRLLQLTSNQSKYAKPFSVDSKDSETPA